MTCADFAIASPEVRETFANDLDDFSSFESDQVVVSLTSTGERQVTTYRALGAEQEPLPAFLDELCAVQQPDESVVQVLNDYMDVRWYEEEATCGIAVSAGGEQTRNIWISAAFEIAQAEAARTDEAALQWPAESDIVTLCALWPDTPLPDLVLDFARNPEALSQQIRRASSLQGVDTVFSVTDVDGYTFDVHVQYRLQELEQSTANDKPGYMSAVFHSGLSFELVNQTPGRNISFKPMDMVVYSVGEPAFQLIAVWNGDRAICQTDYVDRSAPGRECSIVLGFGFMHSDLPAGGSSVLEDVYVGQVNNGSLGGVQGIPESAWPAIEDEILYPDDIRLAYRGGDYLRFWTQCGDAELSWGTGPGVDFYVGTTIGSRSGNVCAQYSWLPQPGQTVQF